MRCVWFVGHNRVTGTRLVKTDYAARWNSLKRAGADLFAIFLQLVKEAGVPFCVEVDDPQNCRSLEGVCQLVVKVSFIVG